MSTTTAPHGASAAEGGEHTATPSAVQPVRIWDWPVRITHWLLALSFAGAWLTAEQERWHLVHITLGYTAGGLVVFRLLWGLFGSRPARFASFVRGPGAAWRYLRSLAAGRPEHHAGHNPAGALAIVALLGLTALTVLAGWATEYEWLPASLDELHEALATALLVVVGVHLAGVLIGSLAHRENLVAAMGHGRKRAPAGAAIRSSHALLGAGVLAAVLGFWGWQTLQAPVGLTVDKTGLSEGAQHGSSNGDHDEDDDD